MKREYYVVDEDDFTVKKALLDLESSEWYHTFESEDGVQYKDPIACSRCKMIKHYNELTNDERIRTGKSYAEQNIFNNERDAKMRLDMIILEKMYDIDIEKIRLDEERNKLFKLYINGRK